MKLQLFSLLLPLALFSNLLSAQDFSWQKAKEKKKGRLQVYCFENMPFANYNQDKKTHEGIELDIIHYFAEWVRKEKQIDLKVDFIEFQNFESFLDGFSSGGNNTVGAGATTITAERKDHYTFSSPYLRNTSVLITDGEIPTILNDDMIPIHLSGLVPVVIKGSVHEQYIIQLIKDNNLAVLPKYVANTDEFFTTLQSSARYYGYADILTFWSYLKSNKGHFIKMHKRLNISNEYFAFLFKPGSDWEKPFREFFETGFGFTATKDYQKILQKYLGEEVIKYVELD